VTHLINEILDREDLSSYFTEILGSDVHTSKSEKIKKLIEKYNITSKDAIYITDTLGDIKEAEGCGVKSIAVTWGFHDRKTLEKGNPVAIIDEPMDLLEAIENVLK
jgi:phosphoglycolate phosphatase